MSSQSPTSSLANAHSFPFRTSSDSSSRRRASSTSTNLYVTFKVLQLVNSFRKRVKTRVRSSRIPKKETSTRITEDFCQDFERQAFQEIDRYLGRKTTKRTRKTTYPKRRYSPIRDNDPKSIEAKRTSVATFQEQRQARSVQWLLNELDEAVKSDSHSVIAVAKDHELFLSRKNDFDVKRLTARDFTQLLVVVKDLLATLDRDNRIHSNIKTFEEGHALLDLSLDETKGANLEHLLLCVKDQILRLLVSKLVDFVRKELVDCQRDQNLHSEEWFFEFPDARHPLSTTWPWSIRPSLAVIWGVCWMFYDRFEDNWYTSEDGERIFSTDEWQALLQRQQRAMLQQQPRSQSAQQLHFYPSATNLGQAIQSMHSPSADPRRPRSFAHPHSPGAAAGQIMTQPLQQHRGLTVATTSAPNPLPLYSAPPDQAAHTSAGLAIGGTNNSYPAAPPSSYAPPSAQPALSAGNWSLPQENFDPHPLGFHHDNTLGADEGAQWAQLVRQHSHYNPDNWQSSSPSNLPPRSQNSVTPNIRVITDPSEWPAHQQQQPEDTIYHSATSISTASSHPLVETPHIPYSTHNLSPLDARTFMNSDEKMQHTPPRSPHHPHSPQTMAVAVMSEQQLARKRSHDEMIGNQQIVHPIEGGHSRSGSIASPHQDLSAGEAISPRTRTIKRGEPPSNGQGKYICDFAEECDGLTFDRKCEWSKHMDKHDRPYRCQHPECAKLQGFTYSGGLLRHEREVHNKHGGPKATLVCPHPDCKRHTGKGFTRRENLNEHVRRVHENRNSQSQSQVVQPDLNNALNSAEEMETPYFTQPMNPEDTDSPMHKRRRYTQGMSERSASVDVEDLRQEVDRLRHENQEKDSRLQQMQDQLEQLQQSMQLLQSQQSQAPGPV